MLHDGLLAADTRLDVRLDFPRCQPPAARNAFYLLDFIYGFPTSQRLKTSLSVLFERSEFQL